MKELYDWPQRSFDRLVSSTHGDECRALLREYFCGGVDLRSYYSGKGTAESALEMIANVIAKDMESDGTTLPHPPRGFQCSHACDSNSTCRHVLANMNSGMKPQHIFGDLHHRLPEQAHTEYTSMEPNPKRTHTENIAASERLRHMLFEKRAQYYNKEASAYCFVHGRHCKLWATEVNTGGRSLVIVIAGFSCTDFCKRRVGRKPGFGGSTARAFWEFLAELLEMRPDIVLYENSDHFPASVFDLHTSSQFKHVHFNVGPDVLGWPVSRPRLFGALFNIQTVYFIGNPSEFLDLFECTVELFADALFQSPAKETTATLVSRARARGYLVDETMKVSNDMLMSPIMRQRLNDYATIRSERQALNGVFVCDLEQNKEYANSGGFLPSTPTHGTIYSFTDNRIMTGKEILAAMGTPCLLLCSIIPSGAL